MRGPAPSPVPGRSCRTSVRCRGGACRLPGWAPGTMAAPRAWRELSCPEVVERAQQCPGPQTPTHLPSPALPLLRSHGGPGRDPGGPVGGICALARTRTAQEKGRRRMKSWGSAHRGPGAANKPPDTGSWGEGRGQPGPAPSLAGCPATSEESLALTAWCPEDGQGPVGLVLGVVLLGARGSQG